MGLLKIKTAKIKTGQDNDQQESKINKMTGQFPTSAQKLIC
jgi:hypothetical protein